MARGRGGDLQTLRNGAYRKVNARSYCDSQAGNRCVLSSVLAKEKESDMSQTNIERFDEVAAKVLTALYERFPQPVGLDPNIIGMMDEHPEQNELGEIIHSEEWHELDLFIHWTAKWLAEEGYLSNRSGMMSSSFTLSAMGIKSLKHVDQPEIGSETLGEKIKNASTEGSRAVTSKLMDQFLSIGATVLTKTMGLD